LLIISDLILSLFSGSWKA